MKEGEIPKVGSYVNLVGTAYLVINGNCKTCFARGNLELCNRLPTCYDKELKKSIVAFEKVAAR